MSRRLTLGIMLTMISLGLGITFFVVIVMTPNFDNWSGAGWTFALLGIIFFYGLYEIEQVNKWIANHDV